jgi:hypothetical protein
MTKDVHIFIMIFVIQCFFFVKIFQVCRTDFKTGKRQKMKITAKTDLYEMYNTFKSDF